MAEFTADSNYNYSEENKKDNPYELTENEKELVAWITDKTDDWRSYRDQNFLDDWLEYERLFRGIWAAEDTMRSSERSRVISPALQQAIETRHAEIMEAIFGNGDFFTIEDDVKDANKVDVEMIQRMLTEDFKKDKIRKSIDQIELMAELYGTGIGEVVLKTKTEYIPTTQAVPGMQGAAAIGVTEKPRFSVELHPVNPKNFLIDPNATTIDDALGVAVEKYVSIHKVVAGIEAGIYRKCDLNATDVDENLEATQEISTYQNGKVKLLTYYGLVPREYLLQGDEKPSDELSEMFKEGSEAEDYSDLVEALVVIANDVHLLKAEESPYMMKDRPIIAYQDDTMPNRFHGRGTAEKAFNMQKAIDAQLRSHLDSLALTTAPMIAMDATRLPRGAKFEVKPGKALLVNGAPSEILYPFQFGQTNGNALMMGKEFERMLLMATGTLDSQGMVSQGGRDGAQGGMGAAMAGIIKKYKRTLSNFQEDFLIPFIYKAVWRYMQFDNERYPMVDLNFIPASSLGMMAREHEQQMMIGLLQTLGPNTPVLPVLLKGIIQNSSLQNKEELAATLDKMSQPNPEQAQMQQQAMQMDMQAKQAQLQLVQSQAKNQEAQANFKMVEAQLKPQEMQAKIVSSLSTNLPDGQNNDKDFEKRAKIAELMLKEKDITSNERIAVAQMANKANKS